MPTSKSPLTSCTLLGCNILPYCHVVKQYWLGIFSALLWRRSCATLSKQDDVILVQKCNGRCCFQNEQFTASIKKVKQPTELVSFHICLWNARAHNKKVTAVVLQYMHSLFHGMILCSFSHPISLLRTCA